MQFDIVDKFNMISNGLSRIYMKQKHEKLMTNKDFSSIVVNTKDFNPGLYLILITFVEGN